MIGFRLTTPSTTDEIYYTSRKFSKKIEAALDGHTYIHYFSKNCILKVTCAKVNRITDKELTHRSLGFQGYECLLSRIIDNAQ